MQPLVGGELRDMWRVTAQGGVRTDSQKALATRLGPEWNNYVNAYGPGGQWYNAVYQSFGSASDKDILAIENRYSSPVAWAQAKGRNPDTIASSWPAFNAKIGFAPA